MIIYLITNKINGKKYVGQTIQKIDARWSKHCHLYKANRGMPIAHAIQKYGKENFEITILERCSSINEMNILEKQYIESLKTMTPNGYNVFSGGKNSLHTEETRKKISESQSGEKNHNFGKIASIKTKEKMSKSQIGKHRFSLKQRIAISERVSGDKHPMYGKNHTEKSRNKISQSLKGLNNWSLGKKISEETRKKISIANKGRKPSKETREKLSIINSSSEMEVVCLQNGKKYRSTSEAARSLGLLRSKVKSVLKGKSQHVCGYSFEYTNKINVNKKINSKQKKTIICLETNEVYESILKAIKTLGVHAPGVYRSLRTGKQTKGYTFQYVNKDSA